MAPTLGGACGSSDKQRPNAKRSYAWLAWGWSTGRTSPGFIDPNTDQAVKYKDRNFLRLAKWVEEHRSVIEICLKGTRDYRAALAWAHLQSI